MKYNFPACPVIEHRREGSNIAKSVVWITGASSGLGKYTAQALAQAGYEVVAGARSFGANPGRGEDGIFRLPLDVTDLQSIRGFVKTALEISPRVDILVSCAAILVLGPCEETSREEYSSVMQTNFLGAVSMVQAVLPVMRRQRTGKIVIFSSFNGLFGIPFQSAYTASKHALEGYAECLALETRPFGIQVCLVEPGDHRDGSSAYRLHAKQMSAASPYKGDFERGTAVIMRDEGEGSLPAQLGQKIVKLVARRRMPLRCKVAKPLEYLSLFLHSFLPSGIFIPILSLYYHTGKGDAVHEEKKKPHLGAQ